MQTLRSSEPVRPRLFNPKLSRDLEAIILKCLQKDPGSRYVTALSLADDLRRWLDGRPAQGGRVSLLGRGWRWCRRRPDAASLAASILVCFLAVFEFYRRADTQRQAHTQLTRLPIGASTLHRALSAALKFRNSPAVGNT